MKYIVRTPTFTRQERQPVSFTREQCIRTALRYVALSRLYSRLEDRQRAAGLLNSAHFWRNVWQRNGGLL